MLSFGHGIVENVNSVLAVNSIFCHFFCDTPFVS